MPIQTPMVGVRRMSYDGWTHQLERPAGAGEHRDSSTRLADYREAFLAALLAVDSRAAEAVICDALSKQVEPAAIDTHIIGAAMVDIGARWERKQVTVAQEHLATGIASQAAWQTAGSQGPLSGLGSDRVVPQTVLLANVDGEDHALGLRMVADILHLLGHDVRYLGSKVPGAELCSAAVRTCPDVIGLSLTLSELGPRLVEQAAALRAACPDAQLLLGGQGVSTELAERVGAPLIRDVEELVALAAEWPRAEPAPAAP